jgi:hypothetical protein
VPLTALAPDRYLRARKLFIAIRNRPLPHTDLTKLQTLIAETATCDGPIEKARFVSRGLAYTALRRLRDTFPGGTF